MDSTTRDELTATRAYCDRRAAHGREGAVRDPSDCRGLKNRFINHVLKQAFADEMTWQGTEIALDLGCGTGILTESLAAGAAMAVGLDISFAMLAQKPGMENVLFCQYDGITFPLAASTFDRICTCEVIHLLSDSILRRVIRECQRVLKPDGEMISVEFGSGSPMRQDGRLGRFERDPEATIALFRTEGLCCQRHYAVRRGRSLIQYLIRYGLVPESRFPELARRERLRLRGRTAYKPTYNADFLYVFHHAHG